jgi:hypothetical protein
MIPMKKSQIGHIDALLLVAVISKADAKTGEAAPAMCAPKLCALPVLPNRQGSK